MSEQKKFYLTTPIYYVNARPHIGHAYTTIVADVLARRHRLLGEDTMFLTGTDEHGQKIERSAAAAGIPPQQFADQVSAQFRSLWDRMGLTHDRYIRTTDEHHKQGVQRLFAKLYEGGHIYLASYTGSYCVSDEAFVDAPVGTPCPDCGRLLEEVTEENFFFRLSAFQEQLITKIESGEILITPESAKNEVLSFVRGNVAEAERNAGHPERSAAESKDPEGSEPATTAGTVSTTKLAKTAGGTTYVPGALKDLSVSRSSFTWGIPVPEPAASASQQKHVIYVWLDALANYMTAVGYGSDDPKDVADFARYWPADLHLVGKEITRFHCVYWPAFLMAAGLPLPKQITANGWLLFDNAKMSKSKGNVVRTETILEAFGEQVYAKQFPESTKRERDLFASDVLRYHLLREIPYGQDGSFTFEAMVTRYNADLANGYGNLVSRTLNMVGKYFDGIVPDSKSLHLFERFGRLDRGDYSMIAFGPDDIFAAMRDEAYAEAPMAWHWAYMNSDSLESAFDKACEELQFSSALEVLNWGIAQIDRFISRHVPWKIAAISGDEAREALKEILYTAAQGVRIITALLHPILPAATAKVWAQLGLGDIEQAAKNGELKNLEWGGLKPGTKLGTLAPIFPRADKGLAQIMADIEEQNAAPKPSHETPLKAATTPAHFAPTPDNSLDPAAPPRCLDEPCGELPVAGSTEVSTRDAAAVPTLTETAPAPTGPSDASPQIGIDDFAKVELRVAQVLVADRIPKADKLLRLDVDLGYEKRQILSGIAEHYAPEDLVGRRIIVITNLAPRKMRGLESHGMLLAASEEGGKPFLATVPEGVPIGTRLK